MTGLRAEQCRGDTVDTMVSDNVGGREAKGDLCALGHGHKLYYSICERFYSLFQKLELKT